MEINGGTGRFRNARSLAAGASFCENLHRVDLTKEQRDRKIRRYAELLEAKEAAKAGSDNLSAPARDSRGQRKSPQQQEGRDVMGCAVSEKM